MATYEQLGDAFKNSSGYPGANDPAQIGTDKWNDNFNRWTIGLMHASGASNWDGIPDDMLTPEGQKAAAAKIGETLTNADLNDPTNSVLAQWVSGQLPDQYQYNDPTAQTTTQPLEQNLLQNTLPGIEGDVQQDPARQALANQLTQQSTAATQVATDQLRTALQTPNSAKYFQDNPDVASAFNGMPDGSTPGTKSINGQDMTADQFAAYHYNTYGKNEGRSLDYSSPRLGAEQTQAAATGAQLGSSASTAAQQYLAKAKDTLTQMQQNLTGEMAARASALQDQIASLTANLGTLDATQRANLAEQIKQNYANLEQSITDRKTALTQEIASMQGAVGTEATAKQAALNQEISSLNAAMEPVAKARTEAAQQQVTGVNVGLQDTENQLTAQRAQQGFVGNSTMDDAALARAVVGARQNAAQDVASANLANASDTRDVAIKGATGTNDIASALAGAQSNITQQGAAGNFDLASQFATGKQGIGDYGAGQTRTIGDTTAGNLANIQNLGATSTYNNSLYGAGQNAALKNTEAGQEQSIGNQLTQAQQAARDWTTNQQYGNFANDYTRSLGAALQVPGINASLTNNLANIDKYGYTGINNAWNTLGPWTTAPGGAPTPTPYNQQPNPYAGQIGQLGPGVAGAGMQLLGNYFKTPGTPGQGTLGSAPTPPPYLASSGPGYFNSSTYDPNASAGTFAGSGSSGYFNPNFYNVSAPVSG